ncbi:FliM/FliN family flagellar motor switch protein [Candidatus Margulisiibacteriota bacterium]
MYKKTIRLAPAIPDWTKLERLPTSERGEASLPDTFEKISQESVDRGLIILQDFGDDLCKRLSEQLVISFSLHRLQVTKFSNEEFIEQKSREFLVQADLDYPDGSKLYSFWGYSLAQALINRSTGGAGEAKIENEEFTTIEKAIFENVLQEALRSFAQAWGNVISGSPQKIAVHTPRLKPMESIAEREEVLLLSAEIGMGDQEPQPVSWLFPVSTFAKLFTQWDSRPKARKAKIELAPFSVSMVDVPVAATLGKAIVSMSDLLQLQRGDVVVLDNQINQPSFVFIGTDAQFQAQPGIYNKRLAVQLLDPLTSSSAQITNIAEKKGSGAEIPVIEEEIGLDEETRPATKVAESPNAPEEEEDDILANIDDLNDDDDDDFVWEEEDTLDEDF